MSATLTFDPELAYPSYDKPFLESWNGRYEAVFVALHPFFRMPDRDPVGEGYLATAHSTTVAGKEAFQKAQEEARPGTTQFLERGSGGSRLFASMGHPEGGWEKAQRVAWSEVAEQTDLGSREKVGAALLALIGALRDPHEEKVAKLVAYCERTRTFPPGEGRFERLHFEPFLDLFRRASSPAVISQEEFEGDPVLDHTYSEFESTWPHRGSLYNPDKSVLIVVDWDSYFTLIAGDRALLESWAKDHALDGFFADETTTHDWWAGPAQLN